MNELTFFLGDGPGSIKTIHSSEEIRGTKNIDRNIQIVDENGDTIVFMDKVIWFLTKGEKLLNISPIEMCSL